MPLFDYVCKRCEKTSELLVTASTVPTCPECGSRKMSKLLSLPAEPGKSKRIIAAGRARAASEGHLSNFSSKEIPRRPR